MIGEKRTETATRATETANIGPSVVGPYAGTVLDWVNRYGLATVLSVCLLAYLLWTDYNRQAMLIPALDRLADNQAQIVLTQQQIVSTLRDLQSGVCRTNGPMR